MSAQFAIACLVTLRPNEVQPFDQALQRLEILQAVNVFRAYLTASCCHGSHYGNFEPRAQLSPPSLDSLVSLAQISCRTLLGRSLLLFSTKYAAHRGSTFVTCPVGSSASAEEIQIGESFIGETDATIMGFLPHLHVRGKARRSQVTPAGGTLTTLLDIPRSDFNRQPLYRLREPLTVEAGLTPTFTAWYDNSGINPANPDPTKTARWGPQTFDEIHLGYVEYFVSAATPRQPLPGNTPPVGVDP